ncbi:DnaA/Hda family protein [Gammaproteobacteria bacterium]|nr:DnaA/Hda family protein [Gammaproteobacteria bacterium]MDA7600658.1 DnaA/Hda family protein [Gammaproteobacteria bacterium]MDB4850482.1 DnaA/Hda family protein [Gammaproteobacteria bacterium]MDC0885309.1 DnaA/Hda family protein [Gammaproteobacteria bacterium]MDC0914503.1 DnaA/Hda family protein [Gammaproteobacteria bacterium]
MNKPKQLIFPFQINQKASFDSFFCSPDNQNLMTRLADIVSGPDTSELIIHGEEGSGKSFLMQAICNELSSAEKQFAFIPMKKAFNMGVEIFQNLGSLDAVCIDDLQLILANQDWETALFNLINECQQSNCSLMLSLGGTQPLDESVILPDLLSRIKRMEFIALHAVQDEFFNQAIDFVAQQLDIKIEEAELEFLLKHQTRIFSLLVENIITLDNQAASLKRKITIPLIKETLNF